MYAFTMKINTLDIHQFGRFQNEKISLPNSPFVIIYGENETGKSTLTQFMLNTLFGFPQKNELAKWTRLNDEHQIGGALSFVGDDGKLYKLERMYKEKDTPRLLAGSSEAGDIHTMLRGVDRLLYQNVFCFDLDGLRGIEKMEPSDLNDFLLGAGMIGSRELARLEQALEKKSAALFKKGGKKPEINRLLNQLDKLHAERRKWEQKLDTYLSLQEKIRQGRKRIAIIDQEKKNVEQKYKDRAAYLSLKPVMSSYRALENELRKTGPVPYFPENGKSRFDQLSARMVSLEGETAELTERIRQLDASIKEINVETIWLEEGGHLDSLFRSAVRDERNLQEIQRIKGELHNRERDYSKALEELGPGWTADKIKNASAELDFRKQLKEELERWRAASARLKDAERILGDQEEAARQLSDRLEVLKSERQAGDTSTRERSAPGTKGRQAPVKFLSPLSIIVPALLVIIGSTAAAGYLIAPGAGVFAALCGLAISLLFIARDVRFPDGGRPNSNDKDKWDATQREAEWSLAQKQLAEANKTAARRMADVRRLEGEMADEERQFREWLKAKGYPIERLEWADEIVRIAGDARQLLRQIDDLRSRMKGLSEQHERFEQERKRLAAKLDSPEAGIDSLEQRFLLEKEKQQKINDLKKQRDIYDKQNQALRKKLDRFREERDHLLNSAGVQNEKQFYEAADRYEHSLHLKEKRDDRLLQMREITGREDTLRRFLNDFDGQRWETVTETELEEKLSLLEEESKAIRDRLIKDQAECRSLEENHSYRDTLDRYQTLLAELHQKAREWAVYQSAQWAIKKVKDQYREKKLPKVLEKAQRCFNEMTDGIYVSLYLNEKDGFLAERRDGKLFPASELSRGTAEQLYLSLRIALTELFDAGETLPLIIDDGLVNFDHYREDNVYSLLERLSRRRQVILFTCHESAFLKDHPSVVYSLSQ
ncbi:hypothetical protein EWI07_08075 [Sporolactobacillus sp. THM7-4]|nr:hypothetical protein EWI07_08075 [Sporolactobacillus sp. THM7-4]